MNRAAWAGRGPGFEVYRDPLNAKQPKVTAARRRARNP